MQVAGGGVYLHLIKSATLTSCSFSENRARVCVRLVWLGRVRAVLCAHQHTMRCVLTAGHTRCGHAHAGLRDICLSTCSMSFSVLCLCVQSSGGGMRVLKATVTLTSCLFSDNSAKVCLCLVWLEDTQAVVCAHNSTSNMPCAACCHKDSDILDACMCMLRRGSPISCTALVKLQQFSTLHTCPHSLSESVN